MADDALVLKNVLDELNAARTRGKPIDPASVGIRHGHVEAPLSEFRPTAVIAAAEEQRARENPPPPLTSEEHEAELRDSHEALEQTGLRVPSSLVTEPDTPAVSEPTPNKRRGLLRRLLRIT